MQQFEPFDCMPDIFMVNLFKQKIKIRVNHNMVHRKLVKLRHAFDHIHKKLILGGKPVFL